MISDKHLEPAKTVIDKVGGIDAAAKITGKHVSRIYRWMKPREKGGTGGVVPHDDATKLLMHAQQTGLDLAPGDFFSKAIAVAS